MEANCDMHYRCSVQQPMRRMISRGHARLSTCTFHDQVSCCSQRTEAQVAAMTRSQAGAAANSRKSSSGSSSSSGVVERALHRSRQRPSHAVHALVRQIACRNTIV